MFSGVDWEGSGVALLSATLAVMYIIHRLVQRKRYIDKINKLPGPPLEGTTWLAHLGPIMATYGTIPNNPEIPQVVPCFMRWSEEHSESGIYRIWAFDPYRLPFARASVNVIDPDLIRQLLETPVLEASGSGSRKHKSKLVKEKRIFGISAPVVGSSLLGLPDNAEWKHQRKMVAPAFHQTVLDETCRVSTDLLCNVIFPKWDNDKSGSGSGGDGGKAVEAVELSTRLTLEVLGKVAFSYPFGGLRAYQDDALSDQDEDDSLYATYQAILMTISKRLRSPPFASSLPTRENIRFLMHSRKLYSVIENIVKDRLKKEIEIESVQNTKGQRTSKDLLSQLLLKDEDGYRLPFKYIHGNVRMFLFAGHDTTASTLAYALWELAKSTQVQQRLRQEVDQLFESSADENNPSSTQLMQLHYLDAVVKETLRLHAPVGVARTAVDDITLKKGDKTFLIPKETSIFVFPLYTHLSKEYWKDRPEEFLPDRFLEVDPATDSSSRRKVTSPWLPFSIGPRNCIGQNLASVELKTILAHVVHRYIIKANEAAVEPIPVFLLTIKPHSVLLDFERRQDAE
jgi:cytochrome P450